jgi:hypothetical protein
MNTVHLLHFLQPPTTELSQFLVDDNQLIICNGINPSYKKGVLYKDLGYSLVGAALEANKSITGLHNFRQTTATQKMLATVNNTAGTNLTLKYFTNVSSTVTTSSAASQKVVSTTTTTGYIAGDSVIIGKNTATEETKVIDTIQAGVSITLTQNLTYTQAIGKTIEQTWTDINVGTTYNAFEDTKTEMEDFIGYCFIVGYDSTDGVFLPSGTVTGTTFSTSDRCTNMPQGKYIKRYRDRLYVANCNIGSTTYPYRVYFSSVPVAGDISWTVATDFLDVDYSEAITGLGENWDRLVIFTEYSAYLYNQSVYKKSWDIGCSNHRTIKNLGEYMIWGNKDNIWASTGGRPTPIGNDILELLMNSTATSWFSEVVDREYNIYLGNTEANGIAYTNCLATFNIETGMWRWRELYNTITVMAKFYSSGDDFLYFGTSAGNVMLKSKYSDTTPVYTDNTKPITAHFRTKAFSFSDPSIRKRITKLIAYAEYAQGLNLSYRLFDKNQEAIQEFKPIGALSQVINEFNKEIKGYFIQIEGKEMSTRQAFRFYGLSFWLLPDEETSRINKQK